MNGKCPECHRVVARPAEEGGLLVLCRQFVLHPDRLTFWCPACKHQQSIPIHVALPLPHGTARLLVRSDRKRPA